MRFNKPTISMRKDIETAFVNARTYWSLDLHVDDGCTYELRVRHAYPEDEFLFLSHDATQRDALEVITRDEFNERVFNVRVHEDMSHEDAEAHLATKVLVMTPGEEAHLAHLKSYWSAFALLFEPAINL